MSILEPEVVAALDVPAAWRLICYFCPGCPSAEDDVPLLELAGWEVRGDPASSLLRR